MVHPEPIWLYVQRLELKYKTWNKQEIYYRPNFNKFNYIKVKQFGFASLRIIWAKLIGNRKREYICYVYNEKTMFIAIY